VGWKNRLKVNKSSFSFATLCAKSLVLTMEMKAVEKIPFGIDLNGKMLDIGENEADRNCRQAAKGFWDECDLSK